MSSVTGFDRLIRKLNELGKAEFVKAEILGASYQIAADAKQNASSIPNIPPEIKQMISSAVIDDGFTAEITQNALPMGAYIEFGTGVFVKVAPEWKDLAWQFYVNGKGRLHAHPYLYPAYEKGRKDFIKALKAKIRQITSR